MSKYSLEYCTDRELPEWLVVKEIYTAKQVSIGEVVFKSFSKEEAECMYDELVILEQAAEYEMFNNQQSEFDLYGDNAMEADYV
mgnify:CR=1 FL=1|jgi:hypothetical protein